MADDNRTPAAVIVIGPTYRRASLYRELCQEQDPGTRMMIVTRAEQLRGMHRPRVIVLDYGVSEGVAQMLRTRGAIVQHDSCDRLIGVKRDG